jgi:hypothetical protein
MIIRDSFRDIKADGFLTMRLRSSHSSSMHIDHMLEELCYHAESIHFSDFRWTHAES